MEQVEAAVSTTTLPAIEASTPEPIRRLRMRCAFRTSLSSGFREFHRGDVITDPATISELLADDDAPVEPMMTLPGPDAARLEAERVARERNEKQDAELRAAVAAAKIEIAFERCQADVGEVEDRLMLAGAFAPIERELQEAFAAAAAVGPRQLLDREMAKIRHTRFESPATKARCMLGFAERWRRLAQLSPAVLSQLGHEERLNELDAHDRLVRGEPPAPQSFSVTAFLASLAARGINCRVEAGLIQIALADALTEPERRDLHANRAEIIEALQRREFF